MPGNPGPGIDWRTGKPAKKNSGGGVLQRIERGKSSADKGGIFGGIADPGTFGGFSFGGIKPAIGSLAEMIEQQAANQKRQAEAAAMASNPGLTSPYQSIQDQLFAAMNGIDVPATPLEELRKIANSQISAQFDPMIAALGQEMAGKEKRGAASQKTARDMYGGLSKDYLSELPALTQQFKAEDDAANARYDQAQQQMQGEYDKQAADQAAVLKRLGIQAAAPDASQQSMDDQAYFQNQMEMDQQQNMNALNQQQNAATTYQRNLGDNALMAGENTAQDIGAQLEDYLSQANSQMTQLRGQKASGVEALLAQLQQQDSQRVDTSRQQEFDNMMQLYNFQLSAQKAAQDAAAAESKNQDSLFKGTSGLSGASNFLAQQYPDQPILTTNLMNQLQDVLNNPEVEKGKFIIDPGNEALGQAPKYSDVGEEYMRGLLRREFEKEGNRYTPGDINNTMDALKAYLGKLR